MTSPSPDVAEIVARLRKPHGLISQLRGWAMDHDGGLATLAETHIGAVAADELDGLLDALDRMKAELDAAQAQIEDIQRENDKLFSRADRMKAELAGARYFKKIVSDHVRKLIPEGQEPGQADSAFGVVGCIITFESALAASAKREEALREALTLARGILSDMASSGIIVTDAHIEAYGSYFVEPGVFERLAALSDGETE